MKSMTRTHAHADQPNDADEALFDTSPTAMNRAAKSRIRSFIERVERLIDERKEVQEQIKEVFAEAKGDGFDVKAMRQVIKIRGMDRAKRLELEALVDLYLATLGEI
jgi:uncharacterized protein (UPF0335 family)